MRTRGRLTAVAGLTASMLITSGAAALAHECMIANRSEQGDRAAGHSDMWLSEDMATHGAYAFTFDALGIPHTEEMLDDAVALHLERGLQEWTAFFMHHTLLTNPNTHEDNPAGARASADGRGVDHWSDSELGQGMFAIALEVAATHGVL